MQVLPGLDSSFSGSTNFQELTIFRTVQTHHGLRDKFVHYIHAFCDNDYVEHSRSKHLGKK